MAGELDAIKARLSERNVSDAEIGRLVGQAVNSGADAQALAEVLQAAYAKMGNKEIVYDQPQELKAQLRTPKEAFSDARELVAKKKELGIEAKPLKKVAEEVIEKPKKEKDADKAAAKAAKEKAKSKKKENKQKDGIDAITKKQQKVIKESAENDKELDKAKKKGKKKDGKGQDGKAADGQQMDKLEKPDLSKFGIKESGKDYIMPVTDEKGVTVNVNVTSEVNQLKSICNKIDDANKVIEQHNQAAEKPNINVDPKAVTAEKDVKAPTDASVAAPAVTTIAPEMTDSIKKAACAAALAGMQGPDGMPKFNEEEIKRLSEAAIAMVKGDKLEKGLNEKKKEEEKTDHGEKPKSLATPTMQVGGRGM